MLIDWFEKFQWYIKMMGEAVSFDAEVTFNYLKEPRTITEDMFLIMKEKKKKTISSRL